MSPEAKSLLPSITILTLTYNCDIPLLKKCFDSVKMQNYPKEKIEHIVMDAGSTNETLKVVREYGCKAYEYPQYRMPGLARMAIGMKKAKNDLILILETDNILIGKDWLKKMVTPFMEEKDIWCTYSMHNGYFKNSNLITKYFALFGINDVFLYYLNKTEKMPLDEKIYNKGKVIKETKNYFITKFNTENLPPMGDNGFMVRRSVMNKLNTKPEDFSHVDVFYSLVAIGYNTFGVVKNSIVHIAKGNVFTQYKNRIFIKRMYYDNVRNIRSYTSFNFNSVSDILNLIKFTILTLTIIIPLFRSIRGYITIKEKAWFIHPYVCLVALFMYTYSEVVFIIKNRILKHIYS